MSVASWLGHSRFFPGLVPKARDLFPIQLQRKKGDKKGCQGWTSSVLNSPGSSWCCHKLYLIFSFFSSWVLPQPEALHRAEINWPLQTCEWERHAQFGEIPVKRYVVQCILYKGVKVTGWSGGTQELCFFWNAEHRPECTCACACTNAHIQTQKIAIFFNPMQYYSAQNVNYKIVSRSHDWEKEYKKCSRKKKLF